MTGYVPGVPVRIATALVQDPAGWWVAVETWTPEYVTHPDHEGPQLAIVAQAQRYGQPGPDGQPEPFPTEAAAEAFAVQTAQRVRALIDAAGLLAAPVSNISDRPTPPPTGRTGR